MLQYKKQKKSFAFYINEKRYKNIPNSLNQVIK